LDLPLPLVTVFVLTWRGEAITVSPVATLLSLHAIAFFLNIWFGYLRKDMKKLSFMWFLYIHLSIPVIVPLRLWWDISPKFIPLLIFFAVLGQLVGARFLPRWLARSEKVT
jgi:hypothetical protein